MKKSILIILSLLFGVTGIAQKKKELIKQVAMLETQKAALQQKWDSLQNSQELNMNNELHSLSYAMGVSFGSDIKESGLDSISYSAFSVALQDVMKGTEKMSAEDASNQVRATMGKIEAERNKKLKAASAQFLAENAKRPGITTTDSGLQYEIITAAEGTKPTTTDRVKVHYTGMLPDGEVFDSSVERGEPIVFGVTGVIKGWTEALQMMPVGSKWKLYIPHDLAYGERGAGGGAIPPFAVLVFDVELLEIEAK